MSSGYFGQSDQMEHRNLGREMSNIAKTSEPMLGIMSAQAQQQGQDQLTLSREFADQALAYYPMLAGAERNATRKQRSADLRDLQQMGGQFRTQLGQIAPEWDRSIAALDAHVARAGETSPLLQSLTAEAMGRGPSAIRTALERQATGELALGRALSPEEIRDATQAARAAYSSRGLAYSAPAVTAEILNRDRFGREREGQRRQFAAGVQALAQGEDAANRQFASGVESMDAAQKDAARRFVAGAVGVQQNTLAPVLGMFGTRTSVAPTASAGMMSAAPNIVGAGNAAMSPLLGYGSDLYNTNFNADAATRLNNANNMAAIHGAIIGAVGSMAGAATKACWVARAIFGTEMVMVDGVPRLKWMVFREWLMERAPKWFRWLYLRYGEQFAAWLQKQPQVKAALRPWFEARVEAEVEREAVLAPLGMAAGI